MTLEEIEKLVEENLVVRVYCGEVYIRQLIREYLESGHKFVFQYTYNGTPDFSNTKHPFGCKNTVFKLKGIDNSYLEIIYDYFLDDIKLHMVLEPETKRLKRSGIPVIVLPFKKEIIDNYGDNT